VSISKIINKRISPEYVLLGFLYHGPSHGYELNKRLADEFGYIWRVRQSQTYNILNRLELQGFISSTAVEQEKLPPRQLLHLTEAGIQRFTAWLNTPTRCSVHAIRVEFVTRLYFTRQYYPARTQEMIRIQLAELRAGIKRLRVTRASLAGDHTFDRLALDLRIRLLNSILGWLKECEEAIISQNGHGGDHK